MMFRIRSGFGVVLIAVAASPMVRLSPAQAQCVPEEVAKLTASDPGSGDQLGLSMQRSGDTVVVGSWLDDNAAGTDAGAAYVFVYSEGNWTQQAMLTAPDGGSGELFGMAVAISGDTLAVGCPRDDGAAGTDQGSVYIFVRSGTTWSQQAKLLPSDPVALDLFGWAAIALQGDTLLVGAVDSHGGSGVGTGAAYVFVRNGTSWTQEARLLASDGAADDDFGNAAALDGDTAVIGAGTDNGPAGADQGSAYVFVRSAGVWTQQDQLRASDAQAGDNFGVSVAVSSDTVVVGAPFEDSSASGVDGNQADNSASNSGAAYVFTGVGPSIPGDSDGDGDVDLADYANFADCLDQPVPNQECLDSFDWDDDGDVDLMDFATFQVAFTG